MARQIEIIIRRLSSLSTLPEVAAGFLGKLTFQQGDFEEFSEIVESDPALTARILSLAYTQQLTFRDGKPTIGQALGAASPVTRTRRGNFDQSFRGL